MRPINARFDSVCPACEEPIRAGQRVVRSPYFEWVHPECRGHREMVAGLKRSE